MVTSFVCGICYISSTLPFNDLGRMRLLYTFAFTFGLIAATSAQAPLHIFTFQANSDLPADALKLILVSVHPLDDKVKMGIEGRTLRVGLHRDVPAHEVLAAVNNAGVGSFFQRLGTERSDETTTPTATSVFPVRVNSGDPVQDDATYDQAKRAWIQANPGAYQQLQNTSIVEPSTEQE